MFVISGQNLELPGQGAVRHNGTEAMPIGAQDVGQDQSVQGVRLSTGGAVAISVATDHLGVDGIDGIPQIKQKADHQSFVGLQGHKYLIPVRCEHRETTVEFVQSLSSVRDDELGHSLTPLVYYTDIMS
jgi:hypothetical protein